MTLASNKYLEHIGDIKKLSAFLSTFFFFGAVNSFELNILLYLKSVNQDFIWALIVIVENASIVVMPTLVGSMCSRFGNLRVAKLSTLLTSMLFFASFAVHSFLYIAFFLFPFLLRIFNNSMNPYISKISESGNLPLVFAIRDFFLYLGIAFGLLTSSLLVNFNLSINAFMGVYGLAFLLSAISLFLNRENSHSVKSEDIKLEFSLKIVNQLQSKKVLLIFIGLFTSFSWIAVVIRRIPSFFSDLGYSISDVFFTYSMTYFIVPTLAIAVSSFANKENLRKWYLLDILFDVLPLSMLIFAGVSPMIVVLIALLIQTRDFLSPIGIAYFFNNFEEDDQNLAWGVLGSVSSLIALPFPLLVVVMFDMSVPTLVIVSIVIVFITFAVAYTSLPSLRSEKTIT